MIPLASARFHSPQESAAAAGLARCRLSGLAPHPYDVHVAALAFESVSHGLRRARLLRVIVRIHVPSESQLRLRASTMGTSFSGHPAAYLARVARDSSRANSPRRGAPRATRDHGK